MLEEKNRKCFRYVGIEIGQNQAGDITLEQKQYVDNASQLQLDWSKKVHKNLPMNAAEVDLYKSKVGKLLWLARQSRPDISFDASTV